MNQREFATVLIRTFAFLLLLLGALSIPVDLIRIFGVQISYPPSSWLLYTTIGFIASILGALLTCCAGVIMFLKTDALARWFCRRTGQGQNGVEPPPADK